jgi:sec-independent protein translocase protein TatA
MFSGLGPTELIIILVIVLVLFGAKRVPEIGASIGKGIREFKRNINDVQRNLDEPDRDQRADRLPTGDSVARPAAEEPVREPKRLI